MSAKLISVFSPPRWQKKINQNKDYASGLSNITSDVK